MREGTAVCLFVWASCGLALSAPVLTPIQWCVWESLVLAWHSQSPRGEDGVSEDGPRVIYSPAVWARPVFLDKGVGISVVASVCLRKHLFAFSFSEELS